MSVMCNGLQITKKQNIAVIKETKWRNVSVTCVKNKQKIYVRDFNLRIIVRSRVKSLIGNTIKVNVSIDRVSSHSYRSIIKMHKNYLQSVLLSVMVYHIRNFGSVIRTKCESYGMNGTTIHKTPMDLCLRVMHVKITWITCTQRILLVSVKVSKMWYVMQKKAKL